MADLIVNFTIPEAKVDEYVEYYCYANKNGSMDADGNHIYTDRQWVKEHIIRMVRAQIIKGRLVKHRDSIEAYNANDIQ